LLKKSVDAYKNALTEWTRERVPLSWASTFNNLGTVLRLLGETRKGPRTLEQSVAAFQNALTERTRERVPQEWALTQNNLGAALQSLGKRQGDPKLLAEAVTAYENALKEVTRERTAMGWAMTLANLGAARMVLAEMTENSSIALLALNDFDEVVGYFQEASHSQYMELAVEQRKTAQALVTTLNEQ
jgi:tetratricopeptide (TPR) repeat protein